jgi:hypothetical protein
MYTVSRVDYVCWTPSPLPPLASKKMFSCRLSGRGRVGGVFFRLFKSVKFRLDFRFDVRRFDVRPGLLQFWKTGIKVQSDTPHNLC